MEHKLNKTQLATLYAEYGQDGEEEQVFAEIGAALEGKKDKAVRAKEPIDRQMIEDLRQYNGETYSGTKNTKGKAVNNRNTEDQPPTVHLTRQRCDAVAAKIINMLMPTNERGWSLGSTPSPELAKMAGDEEIATDDSGQTVRDDEGQPVPAKELAKRIKKAANEKAASMQTEIDDQLKECHLGAKARRGIQTACKLGTSIFAGPVMTGKTAVVREELQNPEGGTVWEKRVVEDTAPGLTLVDPFNFYPQPGAETIEKCEWAFEHQYMNRTEVRNLAKLPGFKASKLRILLDQEVDHGTLRTNMAIRTGVDNQLTENRDRYSVWKYVGPLSAKDLTTLGHLEAEEDETDPLEDDRMCECWMSQGIVLKVKLSPMEETTRLPYYVFNYKRNDNSLWGYSVPYECRDSAEVVNRTWHIALHNTALSSGPQIVMVDGAVKPADGKWVIRGGVKVWKVDDKELFDSYQGKVFQVHQIDARVDDMMKIHERARETLDEEIGFPLIAQGEPTEAVPTASGLAMLMNAQTTVQRGVAQCWDDDVMIPMIEAFYDWNMAYSEKPEIKGDYEVLAFGASRLVQRDLQSQHLMALAGLTDNPRFTGLVKDPDLLQQIVKSSEVDVDAILKTPEEMQAEAENQQADPIAQAAQREAEANAAKAELELQQFQAGTQQGAPEGQITPLEQAKIDLEYEKIRAKDRENEARVIDAQMTRDAAMFKYAEEKEVKLTQIYENKAIKERDAQVKEFTEGMKVKGAMIKEANRGKNLALGRDSF